MPGPMSAPQGVRHDNGARAHGSCQDREQCKGPGCRVRTGKTRHKREGIPSKRYTDELARMSSLSAAGEQENAA